MSGETNSRHELEVVEDGPQSRSDGGHAPSLLLRFLEHETRKDAGHHQSRQKRDPPRAGLGILGGLRVGGAPTQSTGRGWSGQAVRARRRSGGGRLQ